MEEENSRLKQRLARLQHRMVGSSGGAGTSGEIYSETGMTTREGKSNKGTASKATHLRLGHDLQNIVSVIHAQVDRQSDLIKRKQQDGMCVLAHGQIQTVLDRCLTQLASLGTATVKRSAIKMTRGHG